MDLKSEDNSVLKIEDDVKGICPEDSGNLITRFSRFGKFIACANYPKCKYTKSIVKIVKNRKCPLCESDVVVKFTKSKKDFMVVETIRSEVERLVAHKIMKYIFISGGVISGIGKGITVASISSP